MHWLAIGGGIGLAGFALAFAWYWTSKARTDARELAAAKTLAVKVQADLAECTSARAREGEAAVLAVGRRDKEIARLRAEIEATVDLMRRVGGPELVVARLRRVLEPKASGD